MKSKKQRFILLSGRRLLAGLLFAAAGGLSVPSLPAAGILTPTGSADQPVQIQDHHVDVLIMDGFARTVIQQSFSNPNPHPVEAIYAFPVPESASLSEITIHSGETVLEGEVIPRAEAGYFMMTITPGIDLKPITEGVDYLFILDLSGSMKGKMSTLTAGVEKALGKLRPEDRVHIVTFSNQASKLTRDWVALSPANAQELINQVAGLSAGGSTNLYDGLRLGLKQIDADRPTNIVLITDAVTNTGSLDPAEFHKLLKEHDVRLFGFLMGNSANWPLMRAICDASDGFYSSVSNADDIVGKILQAKEKIAYESLLDVDVQVKGLRTSDIAEDFSGKVFRGQQLTIFGRYHGGGGAFGLEVIALLALTGLGLWSRRKH